jgi:hypothetical protein
MNAKVTSLPTSRAPRAAARTLGIHFLDKARHHMNRAQAKLPSEELLAELTEAKICIDNAMLQLGRDR